MTKVSISKSLEDCLLHAQGNNYRSNDVSDLLRTSYYRFTKKLKSKKLQSLMQLPYNKVISKHPELVRSIIRNKGFIYPQGQAMVMRALVELAKKNHVLGDIEEAKLIAQWLIDNRSPLSKHFGWGQPFMWYSRIPFPPRIPRATVSSQVAWAMIDLYEYTGDKKYLRIAEDVCYLFIEEFNYTADSDGDFCLSYTTLDNYHVHNASMLAASVMMRVYKHTKIEKIGSFAERLSMFTKKHQNEDGSFYYWAPPDEMIYKIDNYHTGFVLESFFTIKNDCDHNDYDDTYESGMNYYYSNLFEGPIPKMTNKDTYPIDIQSCAQSIITFNQNRHNDIHQKKSIEITEYTIDNFFLDKKSHFAYRTYSDGRQDQNYYFRWGDAWMIRALSHLV